MAVRRQISVAAKLAMVRGLAAFNTPAEVAEDVSRAFDLKISRQGVERYDPTKHAGRHLSQSLRELFHAERRRVLSDLDGIGIAHRAVRLRALQRMADKAEGMGNLALAAQVLEQAAKEVGDAYTNRRELTGKGGAPLPTAATAIAIFALPDNGRDQLPHGGTILVPQAAAVPA